MPDVKKNERFVPTKNYLIALLVVVIAIALTLYGFQWYKVIEENRISTSYLVKEKVISQEINELKMIEEVFSEVPDSYFLYISYTGDKQIYKMEKELAALIKDYNLYDSFYYLDVTNIKDKDNYIEDINKALNLEDIKVTKVPTVIYFKDGKAVDITAPEGNNIMSVGDLQKLLDVNKIKEQ